MGEAMCKTNATLRRMLRVDEFESVFRSADKEQFELALPKVEKVLVVSDLESDAQARFMEAVRAFLHVPAPKEWVEVAGPEYEEVDQLLEREHAVEPDLVVAYRNLKSNAWRWPYSLGSFLNVLTQKSSTPVLVLPNPHEHPDLAYAHTDTDSVMVVADHLTGDDDLVNWGARMTKVGGKLFLTHIEDDQTFERYIRTIGKIPSIDTDAARADILAQLLKEPTDFIETCRAVLANENAPIEVHAIVKTGHQVSVYRELAVEHDVDLLVFHGRDDDQVAMHGTAYPLAVELRTLPLLLV